MKTHVEEPTDSESESSFIKSTLPKEKEDPEVRLAKIREQNRLRQKAYRERRKQKALQTYSSEDNSNTLVFDNIRPSKIEKFLGNRFPDGVDGIYLTKMTRTGPMLMGMYRFVDKKNHKQ